MTVQKEQEAREQQIKELFVSTYRLEAHPEEISSDQELFGPSSAFGLDSMDVLQFIGVLMDNYNFDLGSTRTDTFTSVRTTAKFLNGG